MFSWLGTYVLFNKICAIHCACKEILDRFSLYYWNLRLHWLFALRPVYSFLCVKRSLLLVIVSLSQLWLARGLEICSLVGYITCSKARPKYVSKFAHFLPFVVIYYSCPQMWTCYRDLYQMWTCYRDLKL